MVRWCVRVVSTLFFLFSFQAFAASENAQTFTLDGTLYNTNDFSAPLLDSSAELTIQILDPTKNCILYEEVQTVNTLLTKGKFNIQVGSVVGAGKRSGGNDPGHSMATVYQNISNISAINTGCGGGIYTPGPRDVRYVRLKLKPTSGSSIVMTPDMVLSSQPSAIIAESVQGLDRSKLAEFGTHINANMTPANLLQLFDGSDVGSLHNHDSQYAKLNASTSITLADQETVGFGRFTNVQEAALTGGLNNTTDVGKTWYNSDTGKIMYWDGAGAVVVGAGGGSDNLGNHTATTALNMNSNLINNVTDPSTAQDAATKNYVDGLITGLSTTYVAVSGDAMTGDLTMNAQSDVRFADAAGGEYAAIQAPATIGTNYTLTLPVDDGTPGQVLSTDGSGVLSWATAGGGADNLGNHTATTNIQLGANNISNDGGVGEGLSFDTSGNATFGQALTSTSDFTVNAQSDVRFSDAAGGEYAAIQAPATIGTNYTLTLPVDDGTPNQVLQTDGSGVLSWVAQSGGTPTSRTLTAGTGLTGGGDLSADRTFNVDVGTGANQIVQLNASSELPAVDGSNLTGITASQVSALANVVEDTTPQLGGPLDMNGQNISTANGFNIDITGSAGGDDFTVDTDKLVVEGDTARVGIGTASPEARLEVKTASGADNHIVSTVDDGTSDPMFSLFEPGEVVWNIGFDNDDSNKFKIASGGAWNNFATGTRMIIDTSGNVGIGTTSPSDKLSVNGDVTTNPAFVSVSATPGESGRIRVGWSGNGLGVEDNIVPAQALADATGNLLLSSRTNNPSGIMFYTNAGIDGLERMRITSSGDVGIGTAAPGEKLSVGGVVESTTGGFKFPDGSVQTTALTNSSDWAYKEGPTSFVSAYKNQWNNGGGAGSSIDCTSNTQGCTINTNGTYEVSCVQRSNGTGLSYIGISLDGDRTTLENRVDALWTHDHNNVSGGFSKSYFMGTLSSGNLITCGAATGGDAAQLVYTVNGWSGILTIKRIDGIAGASADHLGNHTATQNIQLGSNYLSGDGDNEGIQIDASGNVSLAQNLTLTGTVDMSGATIADNSISVDDLNFASTDGVNIPQLASDPSTPTAGQMYYNTTSNKMMVYNGSSWTEVGSGSGGSSDYLYAESTTVNVTWNSTTWAGIHNAITFADKRSTGISRSNSTLTIANTGTYYFNFNTVGYGTTKYVAFRLRKTNGTPETVMQKADYTGAQTVADQNPGRLAGIFTANAGDTFEIQYAQKLGTTATWGASNPIDGENMVTASLSVFGIGGGGGSSNLGDSNGVDIPTLASAPSSPDQGQMYYNTGNDKLYVWNGSSWKEVGTGSEGGLGDWSNSYTVGTIYQAPTDLLVLATTVAGTNSVPNLYGYTDSNPTPTTVRVYAASSSYSGIEWPKVNSFTFPVKKGDYWRVTKAFSVGASSTDTINVIPLSGGSTLGDSNGVDIPTLASAPSSPDQGQMYYNTGDDKLYVWNGSAWVEVGSGASGSSDVSFKVHKNGTNQTVTAGVTTKLTWSTEVFDTNNNFASDRFTPTVAGKYIFNASAFCGDAGAGCAVYVYKNGATASHGSYQNTSGVAVSVTSAILDLNGTTDYVEAYVHNSSGTNVSGSIPHTNFSGALISGGSTLGDSNGVDIPTLASAPSSPDQGQMYYNTGDDKLYVWNGSAWKEVGSGSGSAGAGPSFRVHKNGTDQTITNGSATLITWNTEVYDTANNFASNRFTPTVAGKYLFTARGFITNASVYGHIGVSKNGSDVVWGFQRTANPVAGVTAIFDMNGTTDYVEFYADANGTNLDGTPHYTYAMGTLIGGGSTLGDSNGVDIPTLASAPSSPDQGQMYYNTGDDKLYVWNGSAWVEVGSGAGSGGSLVSGTGSGTVHSAAATTNAGFVNFPGTYTISLPSAGTYLVSSHAYYQWSAGCGDIHMRWSGSNIDYYSMDDKWQACGSSGTSRWAKNNQIVVVNAATTITPQYNWTNAGTSGTLQFSGASYVKLNNTASHIAATSDADNDTKIQVEESSDEDIIRFDTAGVERMTINASGAVNMTGAVTATSFTGDGSGLTNIGATAIADNSISVTDLDFASSNGINVPQQASAPGTPATGQMYYNTTENKLMVYNGSTWTAVGSSSGTVGLIGSFPTATCPAGWLAADGTAVSRTTYAALFTSISSMYGAGDGSTTFNLPDYRGQFLRGVDSGAGTDPDAAGRTDRGDGTTGDSVGTKQDSENLSHNHGVTDPGHTHGKTGGWTGFDNVPAGTGFQVGASWHHKEIQISTAFTGISIQNSGGNESRPKNINVTYCISYAGGVSGGGFAADGSAPMTGNISLNDNYLSNDGGNEGIRIDDDGNVGIGTASPGEKLTVVGTIESTTGGIKFPDGTTQTTSATSGTNNSMISGWPDAIKCTDNYVFYTVAPGYYRYEHAGSHATVVFANNSSAAGTLQAGSAFTPPCVGESLDQIRTAGRAFNFAKGPAGQWLQSSNDAYYNAGNVGIGTATPAEALDLGGGNIKMGYETVTNNCGTVSHGSYCFATCPAGKYAISGGCHVGNINAGLFSDAPSGNNQWQCGANMTAIMNAYVKCANIR